MASVINTNMASLVAQRNLSSSQSSMATSVARLSSGMRINTARDDAAGLGISQELQQQMKGLNTSVRNAGDAISVIQTAEGGANEISNILQRMKELTVQGQNGSLSNDQKDSLGDEFNELSAEIDSITARTTFNGISLLDGSGGTLSFQVGSNSSNTYDVDVTTDLSASQIGDGTTDLSVAVDNTTDFAALEDSVDAAIKDVATTRGEFGAAQSRMESAISNMQTMSSNLAAANSRILDTDYASETASLTKGQILQQAGAAMLAQANQMPQVILSLLK